MGKRRKRGRKQPAWKKWVRMGVKIIGTGIGIGVATRPLHRGLGDIAGGNFKSGVDNMVFDLTGIGPEGGTPEIGKLVGTAVSVGVGIGIMKLFSYLARRV